MPVEITLLLLILLLMIGVPVVYSLGVTALTIMMMTTGLRWGIVAQQMMAGLNSFTILAVPMFLLAGNLMNLSGITDRLFKFARIIVGWLPGGLGHVNVVASVIFAGMSGTAIADASGLGLIEIKAMRDAGYDDDFSCAVTAASSTLGPIIPPSMPLVVYGTITGTSIGALFLAGLLPGILMAVLMMSLVSIITVRKKYPRDKFPTFKETVDGVKGGIIPLLAPVILLLGIYTGIFTPTEAAAIVVVYALVVGVFVYKEIHLGNLISILRGAVIEACAIGVLLSTATLFGISIVRALIPQHIMTSLTQLVSSPMVMLLVINLALLVVGMFMDTVVAITILPPILLPIVIAMELSPVHFGIVMVLNLMIGVLSPPFGVVLFVITRIANIGFGRLIKALVPWFIVLLIALMLITFIPQISLMVPTLAGYNIR